MSITCSHTANGPNITAGAASMRSVAQGVVLSTRSVIVIIERRELIRDCLARALRTSGGQEVLAMASLSEWLNICDHTPASLVVLSCAGGADAVQLGQQMQRLSQVKKPAPFVVLSDSEDLTHILGALNKGAKGYIPTNLSLDVAVEAIRLVRAGGVYLPAVCAEPRRAQQDAPRSKRIFTARQAAVVEGIRKGKANKMIAYELNLRESTVKVHIRNIMKKLNAKNRTEVAYIATNLENTGGL